MGFHDRAIRRIFITVIVLALLVPFASGRLLFPAARRLQIRNAQRESVAVANHLTQTMDEEYEEKDEILVLRQEVEQLKKIFDLMAIKYHDADGHLLFSSHDHRATRQRTHPGVTEILALGAPKSHFVAEGQSTYEGIRMNRDIVETYVPVSIRGEKRGVIEIYYDIHSRRSDLEETLRRTAHLGWAISGFFILAALAVLRRADADSLRRKDAEEELKTLNASLEDRVRQRTDELEKANAELESENWERKRIQEKLGESEARFRSITSAARDAIIMVDREARVTFWNPSATELFGYRAHETLGQKLPRLMIPERHLDDFHTGFARFGSSGDGPFLGRTVESTALTKDGTEIAVEISLAPVRIQDQWHALGVVRNITERKETLRALWDSTMRFQKLFEESPEAAILLRQESLAISDVNGAALRLFRTTKEAVKNNGIWRFFEPEKGEILRKRFQRLDASHPTFRIDEVPIHTDDARERILTIHGRILTTGENQNVFCGMLDITDRVHLSRNFEHSMKRLMQAEKMAFLGTMVSGFAHDLNNPNQLIAVNLPLFEKLWTDALPILEKHAEANEMFLPAGLPFSEIRRNLPEMIRDMKSGSGRIDAIIENLLDFSKEDQASGWLYFDLNEVVEAAIVVLKPKIKERTQAFSVELASELPALLGNRQQIEQIIVNLIRNALEALPAPENGVTVMTGGDVTAGTVHVRVEDEGTGIQPEVIEKIRRAFFTTKHAIGGTGLGLAICDIFVSNHHGKLDIQSRDQGGTVVTVTLPTNRGRLNE